MGGSSPGVHALAVVGSDVYAGGECTQTGDGVLTNLGYIVHGTSAHDVYLPLVIKQ
jgi:hypothetical protein